MTNQNSKPKWTAGPWKPFIASHVISVCLPRKNPKDRLVEVVHWCGFDSSDIEDIPELKANCHLIAAAPELYEELSDIVEAIEDDGLAMDDWQFQMESFAKSAKQVLAKARGEK